MVRYLLMMFLNLLIYLKTLKMFRRKFVNINPGARHIINYDIFLEIHNNKKSSNGLERSN